MIIGRRQEIQRLEQTKLSNRSELIAIYGRRRVGKTYLIREFFKSDIVFEWSGLYQGNLKEQLHVFQKELLQKSNSVTNTSVISTWLDAFSQLEIYINQLKTKKKKVIFIDEFPWIATQKSKFQMAFEHFWNTYCSKRNDLIVVICGSAASYMVQNIIKNKGGLHNRITQKIRLLPFNLRETELFLKSKHINFTRYDITQLYMTLGGVPHYLDKVERNLSVAQNIDQLCFSKDGILFNEFEQLYASLFHDSSKHLEIIKTLANAQKGLTRNELIYKLKLGSGGDISLKISELVESGFLSEHPFYKNKKQLMKYRLADEYSRFYLKFIKNKSTLEEGTWQRLHKSQSYISWSGLTFETICLKHIKEIKEALRIDAIYSTNGSWFNENAQIDLLIDRDDNVINLVEIKFYQTEFTLDKTSYSNIKNKRAELMELVKNKKNIQTILITPFGIKPNKYSTEIIDKTLLINDLFR